MKAPKFLPGAAVLIAMAVACNSNKNNESGVDSDSLAAVANSTASAKTQVVPGSYVSLETGEPVYIIEDPETGYAIDSLTKLPVTYYINTSGDTLTTMGEVAHDLVKDDDGTWKFSDGAKVKVDGDKIKIKDGDSKIKIDGDETKVKDGDYKKKTDGDKSKEKDGVTKEKTEDGQTKVKNQ